MEPTRSDVYEQESHLSVYRELRFLLFTGVALIAGGLGRLLYVYADQLDHALIAATTFLVSLFCFGYCLKKKQSFSRKFVPAPDGIFDYALLLACSTMILFLGYVQYHFGIFGERYGLLTLSTAIILLFCAFYFDHRGILGMGISSLAAWLGITLQPAQVFKTGIYSEEALYLTGALLGVALEAAAVLVIRLNFKSHFADTLRWFALHLFLFSTIAGMIMQDEWYWIPMFIAGLTYYFLQSKKESSWAKLMFVTLYFYVGLSYWMMRGLSELGYGNLRVYGTLFYFIVSASLLAYFLISQYSSRDKTRLP